MTKTNVKRNKKEEQKKLMVRIVCMVLVIALIVTSLLAVFPSLFDDHSNEYTLEDLIAAGIVYQGEDGNYYFAEEYVSAEPAEDQSNEAQE